MVDGRLVIVDNPPLVTRVSEDQLGTELRTLFDRAIAAFAERYADQNERDYQSFLGAIKSGRIRAATSG